MGLSVGIIPSIAIGVAAFGAGELIQYTKKKNIPVQKTFEQVIAESKQTNKEIEKIIPEIEDDEMKATIKEIKDTVGKIINYVEKKPDKYEKMDNFFNYYLPVTINILKKYDEIENQKLSSDDSIKFMASTKSMLEKINNAFKQQLSNLYQSEIIDTDAEMKVFSTMLRSDGYDIENDFKIKKGGSK